MTILLVGLCWLLAGVIEAVKDVLAFKFKTSRFRKFNPQWWNPSISWRNKYKEGFESRGERFPGSTHALSFVTDAWHLCQWLIVLLYTASITLVIFDISLTMQPFALVVFIVSLIFLKQGVYRVFYNNVLRMKGHGRRRQDR